MACCSTQPHLDEGRYCFYPPPPPPSVSHWWSINDPALKKRLPEVGRQEGGAPAQRLTATWTRGDTKSINHHRVDWQLCFSSPWQLSEASPRLVSWSSHWTSERLSSSFTAVFRRPHLRLFCSLLRSVFLLEVFVTFFFGLTFFSFSRFLSPLFFCHSPAFISGCFVVVGFFFLVYASFGYSRTWRSVTEDF